MFRSIPLAGLCLALAVPLFGCGVKTSASKNPDRSADARVDSLAELQRIPTQLQAEVDTVLAPIADADVVIDQVGSMIDTLGVDETSLRRMAAASMSGDDEVAIELHLPTATKARVEGVLTRVHETASALRETPAHAEDATERVVALSRRAAGLVAKLTAHYDAQLSDPRLSASTKATLEAELAIVEQLDADIETSASQATQEITVLPSKGRQALAKLTTAFAGSTSV